MNKYGTVDFAPGEDHIALRYPHKNFYVPGVFHNAPTMTRQVPLFISDINTSQSVREIYGPIDGQLRYILLVNNYPITKFTIFGKIVCEKYFNFDASLQESSHRNFFWLTIDDFSGNKLVIDVKVSEDAFKEGGLLIDGAYGKLVSVECYVERAANIRVLGEKLCVLGDDGDLHVELEFWKRTLDYRNVLKVPWVYDPPATNKQEVVSRLSVKDSRRKQHRSDLKITDSIRVPSTEDSLLLSKTRNVCNLDKELDSDVEILEIRPVKVISEVQIYLEIIKWIIRRRFRTFKLIELYRDSTVGHLLETLANLKVACTNLSPSPLLDSIPPQESFSALKGVIFHRARHTLQVHYKLISVSKGQNVTLHPLKLLYRHLKTCLTIIRDDMATKRQVKLLNVKSYLDLVSKDIIDTNIGYRLINGMVDHIVTNEFNRSEWHYDRKSLQWSYRKTDS